MRPPLELQARSMKQTFLCCFPPKAGLPIFPHFIAKDAFPGDGSSVLVHREASRWPVQSHSGNSHAGPSKIEA